MGQLLCARTTHKMLSFKNLVLSAAFVVCCMARQPNIGIFNVVKFPNDVCKGSGTMNGTCYTKEECSDKKGTAAGTCAEGFGVCCIISLNCGETSRDNCTYLKQDSTTSPGSGCTYKICPVSSDINRIRLDFLTFMIAAPVQLPTSTPNAVSGTDAATSGGAALAEPYKSAVGHCATDSFVATGTPVICGDLKGEHMYLDTDGNDCVMAVFAYGGDSSSRQYEIHVTQYDRKNDMGGPTGCLQYFTTDTGTVKSFNFQDDAVSSVTASLVNIGSPHLANQDYSVCIRQNADKCAICYAATKTFASKTVTNSFGLSVTAIDSNSDAVLLQSAATGSSCTTDYIFIPNGLNKGITTSLSGKLVELTSTLLSNDPSGASAGRYCGRFLGWGGANPLQSIASIAFATASQTVCSKATPFSVGVFFDSTEVLLGTPTTGNNEALVTTAGAAGTYGFSLGFAQVAC